MKDSSQNIERNRLQILQKSFTHDKLKTSAPPQLFQNNIPMNYNYQGTDTEITTGRAEAISKLEKSKIHQESRNKPEQKDQLQIRQRMIAKSRKAKNIFKEYGKNQA